MQRRPCPMRLTNRIRCGRRDGNSDIHVMLHVNLSVLVPVLEELVGFDPAQIRAVFEASGHLIQEWEKV